MPTEGSDSSRELPSEQQEAKRSAESPPYPTDDSANSLGTALKTGRSLLLLQLLSRLLTFALNSALLRLSTPEVLGTASIQFDLISATILFLSREGTRNALLRRGPVEASEQRRPSDDSAKWARANDRLACVPLCLGLIVAGTVTSLYLYTSSASTTSQTDFHVALALYVFAAWTELSIEPFYIRCLTSSPPRLRVRVQAEGGMAMVKSIVTFGILYAEPKRALLGFGVGQAAGAGFLALRYLWEYGLDGYLWVGKASAETHYFEPQMKALAIANTRQSVVKHLLTEADRIAVGRISPLQDQGGYAIAMNYGSLIARIIFQPIEETLLLHFSSSSTPNSTASPSTAPLLRLITHLSAHLLLLLPSFLPPLLPPILSILLPKRYQSTSAPTTLKTYLCFYIPLLSLNGILESYHAATASAAQMSIQARWMIASSLAFVLSLWASKTYATDRIGTDTALIGASCMGMIVRIVYAFLYARKQTGMGVRTLFPRSYVTVVSVISGSVLRRMYATGRWRMSWELWAELLGFGGVLGLFTLFVIWRAERHSFAELQKTLKRKTS